MGTRKPNSSISKEEQKKNVGKSTQNKASVNQDARVKTNMKKTTSVSNPSQKKLNEDKSAPTSKVFFEKKITQKRKKERKEKIAKCIAYSILALITSLAIVFSNKIFGELSIFNKSISDHNFINSAYQKIPAVIRSVQIFIICILFYYCLRVGMKKIFARSKRSITIINMLNSFMKYLIAIVGILLILGSWGVDTSTLLASAGILGLVVGLGAQSLIADIIAGVFIVFEGEYEVGDIVVIDGWRGTVSEIGIRTTKIIDVGGNIKVINNSGITSVINQTQELSLATCEIGIEYGESIERVETVIRDNLNIIKEKIPTILDGPYYKGIKQLGSSSVNLLFVANCQEEDLFQTQRDLNRELKLIFDKNKIGIAYPQVVVHQPLKHSKVSNAKLEKGARRFVEQQKALSKDLEEKN